MKKNLLSILILALLIVNLVLTTIVMISVTATNKKTAAVVGDIATVLNLELSPNGKEEEKKEVSIEDTAVYNIEDKMTIPLKPDAEGKPHYAVVSVSLAMNTKDKGYKSYGETLKDKESLIKDEVGAAFGSYTIEQVQADPDAIKQDILKRLQDLFQSEFIYKVTFREMIPQ